MGKEKGWLKGVSEVAHALKGGAGARQCAIVLAMLRLSSRVRHSHQFLQRELDLMSAAASMGHQLDEVARNENS